MAEAFGPGDQRPIPSNFVVLDGLRRSDNGGIENFLVRDLAGELVRLADEPVDRRVALLADPGRAS
jgi:hypothetical protein